MNWSNVKLIWLREVRDQLRDRRTLFMIAVLPLLLYPLLGMSLLQVAQFLQEHPTKVLIVGWKPLPGLPPLVEQTPVPAKDDGGPGGASKAPATSGAGDSHGTDVKFAPKLIGEATRKLLDVTLAAPVEFQMSTDAAKSLAQVRQLMLDKQYDVVVVFPPDFSQRLEQFRQELIHRRDSSKPSPAAAEVPSPAIFHNSVKDKSQVAFARVAQIIRTWQAAIGKQTLRDSDLPETAAQPFAIAQSDVAEPTQRQAAAWSKILPFVLLIWALTGAFYPAIDLAGEKERGTLETLLCSPAERSEIVTGKLLAVMLFSMATSLLNIASLGGTALLVSRQFGSLGAAGLPAGFPPASAIFWLVLALVPASALFSALCLALAVFARSSKEGQYYLMPLILGTMPLMVLPMAPGVELTLGNSLIPLTGLILLLRMLLEGNVHEGRMPFIPPVALVTLICCRVAMKWAVDQFNREHVLFRESERWDMRLWLRHLWRDRGDTPTVGNAVTCGVLILVVQFILTFSISQPSGGGFGELVNLLLISQFVAILAPTLALTWLLTRRPKETLLLRSTSPKTIIAAATLALAVHPLNYALQWVIQNLYPVGPGAEEFKKIESVLHQPPVWWLPLVLLGILPAVCEELAFRGFILSGLRHSGNKWRAILLSSLFFAMSHQILQQSLGTFVLGTLIAFVAVQSGSIWPGLVFHATHNSLAWLHSLGSADLGALEKTQPTLAWIGGNAKRLDEFLNDQPTITGFIVLAAALVVGGIVVWFSRLTYARTEEEELQEAIKHEKAVTTRM